MTDNKLALVRAKIALELADYRSNGDRRHLATITQIMAGHIGALDASSEIRAILLTEKTLPKLKATVGTQKQLEDALIRHFWLGWRGKRPNQQVYSAIKQILIRNNLPWKGETEETIRKRIERMKLDQMDNP